jgi:para-nitrobenzyl esterase
MHPKFPLQNLLERSLLMFLYDSATQEGTLFVAPALGNPAKLQPSDYTTFLQNNFGNFTSEIQASYPVSLFESTTFPTFYAISYIYTSVAYYCPSRRALEATVRAGIPAWGYIFAHSPSCSWISVVTTSEALQLLGATHTSELPFVFSQLTYLPEPNGTCSFSAQEDAISRAMVAAWTAMASNGNPNGENNAPGITGAPWPQFNATAPSGLLVGDTASIGLLNYTQCDLFDQINSVIVGQDPAGGHGNGATSGGNSTQGSGKKGAGVELRVPIQVLLIAVISAIWIG